MDSTRKPPEWVSKLAARASSADVERITKSILAAVDHVSSSRWDAAVQRAADLPGDVRPEKIKALTDSFSRELAALGATAGAAAVAPAVGTVATMAAAAAELAWFTTRAGDLILTIAALHGRSAPGVEERRAWVMAVLVYGGSAREGFAAALNQANTGLDVATHNPVPVATLQTVNRIMSRLILRRYGTRRGAVALGTALPLGIGAVVGGSANYMAVRALARHANEFFIRLPYSSIETTATEAPPGLRSGPIN